MSEHFSNFLDLETIIARLRDEENRWDAILELKLSDNALWADPLVKHLKDPDWIIRWCVAEKLGDMKAIQAVSPLVLALADTDPHVAKNAFYALRKFGPEIVPQLLAFYSFPNSIIRLKIHELLVGFGESIIPLLRKELDKYQWVVGNRIVHLIWEIGKHKEVETLITCLSHKHAQKSAIIFLGALKSIPAIPHFVRLYQKPGLRRTIFYALRVIGKEASFPIIIHSLNNSALTASAEAMILKIGMPMIPFLTKEQERAPRNKKDVFTQLIKRIKEFQG